MLADVKLKMKPTVAILRLDMHSSNAKTIANSSTSAGGSKVISRDVSSKRAIDWTCSSYLLNKDKAAEAVIKDDAKSHPEVTPENKSFRNNDLRNLQTERQDSEDQKEIHLNWSLAKQAKDSSCNQEQPEFTIDKVIKTKHLTERGVGKKVKSFSQNQCLPKERFSNNHSEGQSNNQQQMQTASEQQYYKEFYCELLKLKKELEKEQDMRRKLENKIAQQSHKIKKLKRRTTTGKEGKHPPIQIKLETLKTGKYISTISNSDESLNGTAEMDQFPVTVDEIKIESCVESPSQTIIMEMDSQEHGNFGINKKAGEPIKPVEDYKIIQSSARPRIRKRKRESSKCSINEKCCEKNPLAYAPEKEEGVSITVSKRKNERRHKRYHSILGRSVHQSTLKESLNLINVRQKFYKVEDISKATESEEMKKYCSNKRNFQKPSDTSPKGIVFSKYLNKQIPVCEVASKRTKEEHTIVDSVVNQHNSGLKPQHHFPDDRSSEMYGANERSSHLFKPAMQTVSKQKLKKKIRMTKLLTKNNTANQLPTSEDRLSDITVNHNDEWETETEIGKPKRTRKVTNVNHFGCDDHTEIVTIKDGSNHLPISEIKTSKKAKAKSNVKEGMASVNSSSAGTAKKYPSKNLKSKSLGDSHNPEPAKTNLKYLYGCNLCGLKFTGIESLQCHIPCTGATATKYPFMCNACHDTFTESVGLEEHIRKFHENKVFTCDMCNKYCGSESCLNQHMETHQVPDKINGVIKYHIGKFLKDQNANASHEKRAVTCEKLLTSIPQQRRNIKLFDCSICGKLLSKNSILLHMKQHGQNDREPCLTTDISSLTSNYSIRIGNLNSPNPMSFNFSEKDKISVSLNLIRSRCKHLADRELFEVQMNNESKKDQDDHSELISDQEKILQIINNLQESSNNTCNNDNSVNIQKKSEYQDEEHEPKSIAALKLSTYRSPCLKCFNIFKDYKALEEHLKQCNESYQESSPKVDQDVITETVPCSDDFPSKNAVEGEKGANFDSSRNDIPVNNTALTNLCEVERSNEDSFCIPLMIESPKTSDKATFEYISTAEDSFRPPTKNKIEIKRSCSPLRSNGRRTGFQKKEEEKKTKKRLYGCILCGNIYTTMTSLRHHPRCTNSVSDKDKYFCGKCNETFKEENELENHIHVHSEIPLRKKTSSNTCSEKMHLDKRHKSHAGDRPHMCDQCGKDFKYAHQLKYHVPCNIDTESVIQCKQCQQTFQKISQLRTHLRIDHNKKAQQCELCGKKFAGLYTLRIHTKKHANDSRKLFYCTHCNKRFARNSSLKRHQKTALQGPFMCQTCNQRFHDKYQCDAHIKSHSIPNSAETTKVPNAEDTKSPYCISCCKSFASQQDLNKHMELHKLLGNLFSCSRCKMKFTNLSLLQEHLCQTFSVQGQQFKCPECEEGFQLAKQLKEHLSKVHSIKDNFKCNQCGKGFEKFCLWNYHVQAHRSDKCYVCDRCGKSYKFLHHLKNRHLPCISESELELKCWKCKCEFTKASQLRSHVVLCQNARTVQCGICSRLFSGQSELDKHSRRHTGEKPYRCPQCNKSFAFREGVLNHVQRHSVVKPYVCDVCSKAFATESFLQSHLKCHTVDRPFKCSECDMTFVYACLLQYHTAKVHRGQKRRFQCIICTKTFGTKMYLNIHMCSHTGQNPYLCSFCGKGFPAKILLKYHVRMHTGEKPYTCQYCYRRFSMPRSMRNHERLHTGEKPYECTICGMKFPQSSYLKNHSRKCHLAR